MKSKAGLLITLLVLSLQGAFAQPTIYIAGDSTARNGEARGWGDSLARYFDAGKVQIVNRARAGRSSRTFLTEGLWPSLVADLRPGDFVLIQFGHNDGGPLDAGRARGSLPGTGEESQTVTTPSGATETVHTYGWYLRRFVSDVQARGARPVLLSLTVRNIWTEGKVERGSGQFNRWAEETARTEHCAFVDVTARIADRYERMGEAAVKAFFPEDHTHTTPPGADLNASLIVAGLRSIAGDPFGPLLAPRGSGPGVLLIGDSTVRNGQGDGRNGQWGWGEPLVALLAPVPVLNFAKGGRSSRTFFTGEDWPRALEALLPGDLLVMQFGHNDSGPLDDKARARGTLAGWGEDVLEIANPLTGMRETVHSYGWYLRRYIQAARHVGARPVVCSPVPRKIWKDGKIVRSRYGKWAEEVAAAEGVPFLDLESLIAARYEALGQTEVDALFADEHTHTSRAGAELNAGIVAAQISPILKKAP